MRWVKDGNLVSRLEFAMLIIEGKRMDSLANLIAYVNKKPRIGTLSTANAQGQVDVAIFGSARMLNEKTIVLETQKNRSFANLLSNPNAVFCILEPAQNMPDWKGLRLYLRMTDYQTDGPLLAEAKALLAARVGAAAADSIHATVTFEVTEIRPAVDHGQSWAEAI